MTTFELKKKCERCNSIIPDDFVNLLCPDCYDKLEIEREKQQTTLEAVQKAEILKNPAAPTNPEAAKAVEPTKEDKVELPQGVPSDPKFGIKDPNYQENPEMDDKNQILANLAQFIYTHDPKKGRKGKLLWYPQRNMYNFIKNYCMEKVKAHPQYPKQIWKPHIVDVGCGSGVGTNVLSQEAHFVWGIDKNEWSIEFAKEAFTREKNQIYYSPQVSFDVFDPMNDTRLTAQFDIVVAIEVIEHIHDTDKFLRSIQRFTRKDKKGNVHIPNATEFFISTPNRNSPKIKKDRPDNTYHVREWRKREFYDLLMKYFEQVELYDNKGTPQPDLEGKEDIILAKCSLPKL